MCKSDTREFKIKLDPGAAQCEHALLLKVGKIFKTNWRGKEGNVWVRRGSGGEKIFSDTVSDCFSQKNHKCHCFGSLPVSCFLWASWHCDLKQQRNTQKLSQYQVLVINRHQQLTLTGHRTMQSHFLASICHFPLKNCSLKTGFPYNIPQGRWTKEKMSVR